MSYTNSTRDLAVGAVAPPQNLEAEQAVLGAVLLSDAALMPIIDAGLLPEDFYREAHGLIYQGMLDLHAAGERVDALTVVEHHKRAGQLDRVGGRAAVDLLAACCPSLPSAPSYAAIVRDASHLRQIQAAALKVQHAGSLDEVTAALEVLHSLQTLRADAAGGSSSWAPVDLAAVAANPVPEPDVLTRADGLGLLYRAHLHTLDGEPEAGKGWLLLEAAAGVMRDAGHVVYIDHEDTPGRFVERLAALGVPDGSRDELFHYVRPDEPISPGAVGALLDLDPTLVVVDGMTEAYTLEGLDSYNNQDVARFIARHRALADTGAAVVFVDHLVKDRDARGRYGIGAQHKLAGVAVALRVEVVRPFGRGRSGSVKVTVNKDRPGHLRQHTVGGSVALARLESQAGGDVVTITLNPPAAGVGDNPDAFRPTAIMEQASRHIESDSTCGTREIRDSVGGNARQVDLALEALEADGFITRTPAARGKVEHRSVRPYRQADDPLSDRYTGAPDVATLDHAARLEDDHGDLAA